MTYKVYYSFLDSPRYQWSTTIQLDRSYSLSEEIELEQALRNAISKETNASPGEIIILKVEF